MIVEGEATFTLGDETLVVRGGDAPVVAPPDVAARVQEHRDADGCVTVDIHASPVFKTEWL